MFKLPIIINKEKVKKSIHLNNIIGKDNVGKPCNFDFWIEGICITIFHDYRVFKSKDVTILINVELLMF